MARVVTPETPSPAPVVARALPDQVRADCREFRDSAGYEFLMERLNELLRGVTDNALGYPSQDEVHFRFYKIGVHNGVRDVVRIIKHIMEESK